VTKHQDGVALVTGETLWMLAQQTYMAELLRSKALPMPPEMTAVAHEVESLINCVRYVRDRLSALQYSQTEEHLHHGLSAFEQLGAETRALKDLLRRTYSRPDRSVKE